MARYKVGAIFDVEVTEEAAREIRSRLIGIDATVAGVPPEGQGGAKADLAARFLSAPLPNLIVGGYLVPGATAALLNGIEGLTVTNIEQITEELDD